MEKECCVLYHINKAQKIIYHWVYRCIHWFTRLQAMAFVYFITAL